MPECIVPPIVYDNRCSSTNCSPMVHYKLLPNGSSTVTTGCTLVRPAFAYVRIALIGETIEGSLTSSKNIIFRRTSSCFDFFEEKNEKKTTPDFCDETSIRGLGVDIGQATSNLPSQARSSAIRGPSGRNDRPRPPGTKRALLSSPPCRMARPRGRH